MQKFFNLIITAIILYCVAQYALKDKVVEIRTKDEQASVEQESPQNIETQEAKQSGSFLEKTLSKVLVNTLSTPEGRKFFEHLVTPIGSPDGRQTIKLDGTGFVNSIFQIVTSGEGTAGQVSCGHIIEIDYTISTMSGRLLEQGIKTCALGRKTIMLGLDAVIVGMKPGQTREAIIPPEYGFTVPRKDDDPLEGHRGYKVRVTLKSKMPKESVVDSEVTICDNEISYGMPLVCGQSLSFHAQIIKLTNGKVIYDSKQTGKKIDMFIGDMTYPLIVSYALHGKNPVGIRTVIAPGKDFNPLGSIKINKMLTNPLPNDEYFMLKLYFDNDASKN